MELAALIVAIIFGIANAFFTLYATRDSRFRTAWTLDPVRRWVDGDEQFGVPSQEVGAIRFTNATRDRAEVVQVFNREGSPVGRTEADKGTIEDDESFEVATALGELTDGWTVKWRRPGKRRTYVYRQPSGNSLRRRIRDARLALRG